MTLSKRIGNVFSALFSIMGAVLIYLLGEDGALLVCFLLSLSLVAFGLRNLFFYLTMARHMVNGRAILYIGMIVLDLGIFTLSVSRHQGIFIVLFLLRAYAISGVMDILRALESRKLQAPGWQLKLGEGIVNIAFAMGAVLFGLILGDMKDLTMIYAAGLLYTAAVKLTDAFRKTAIIYIP